MSEKIATAARLSDEELMTAKEAFFLMDKDGSGSIDKEELQFMLHSLGQSANEQELQCLMDEAEGSCGDKNGKIELREFLSWYAHLLRNKRDTSSDDARHVFNAVACGETGLRKESLQQLLAQDFDLDIDLGSMFELKENEEIGLPDFERIVLGSTSPQRQSQRRAPHTRAWQ